MTFDGPTGCDLVVVGCFGAIVGWDGTSTSQAVKGQLDPLSGGACALCQGILGREQEGHQSLVQYGRLHLASKWTRIVGGVIFGVKAILQARSRQMKMNVWGL